jgi:hypothetical protein
MTVPVDDEGHLKVRIVLTIPQVARQFGWNRHRMARHLHRANDRLGGRLLYNMGQGTTRPRWTVSVPALKSLSPQWFLDPEEMQTKFAFLEKHAANTDDSIEEMRAQIRASQAQIDMLVAKVVELQSKVRKTG